jgi:hypothetical protein
MVLLIVIVVNETFTHGVTLIHKGAWTICCI